MEDKHLQSSGRSASGRAKGRGLNLGLLASSLVLTVLAFCVVPLIKYRTGLSHSWQLATRRQPEYFTELYFTDYPNIQKHFVPGQVYSFSFTISNREAVTTQYSYIVTYSDNGQTTKLKQDDVTVAQNARQSVTISFVAPSTSDSLTINVELPNQAESLHMRIMP